MGKEYVSATAMAPASGESNTIELTDNRREYTVHGEIMLLVLVILFAVLIVSLLLCLYLRRLRRLGQQDEEGDSCNNSQMAEQGSKAHVGSVMYPGHQ